MKRIVSILIMAGLVLAFGTAYAAEADSLIFTLDPSKVPGYVELETGAATLPAPKPLFIDRGAAAGGISMEHDTLLNYIDPSKVPGFVDPETGVVTQLPRTFTAQGMAAGGISREHDTFMNYIDPSRVPGYVEPETGVVVR